MTLAILALAFGSLVAASLPLMLTIVGLVASAGVLYLGTLFADISIWSMNFALMFALALGIDYALFIVVRYRAAHFGHGMTPADAAGVAMDTAGKAVLFSGVTVLISLSAVMLVPSPAFRSMALGIMVAVVFILAATLTLLPAVLGALGSKVDNLALKWVHSGEHRSPRFARWAERIWAKPLLYGVPALLVLLALAAPVLGLKTGMPSIKVVPRERHLADRLHPGAGRLRPGRPGRPPARRARSPTPPRSQRSPRPTRASPSAMPAQTSTDGTLRARPGDPQAEPLRPRRRRHHRPSPHAVPAGALVGGAAAENHDLETALANATPLVIGVVLALGFVLLLVALQAPIIALVGVLTNLLATGAAFGVARLIFQDGHLSRPARLRVAGLPRRLGAGVLLRDDLRDLDGLHRLPARLSQGAPRALGRRPARGDDRRRCPLRPRHPRRGRGDGRGVLHLRALRPATAEGDGHHPRRRRRPRRVPRPPAARPRRPAAARPLGLVVPEPLVRILPAVSFGHGHA